MNNLYALEGELDIDLNFSIAAYNHETKIAFKTFKEVYDFGVKNNKNPKKLFNLKNPQDKDKFIKEFYLDFLNKQIELKKDILIDKNFYEYVADCFSYQFNSKILIYGPYFLENKDLLKQEYYKESNYANNHEIIIFAYNNYKNAMHSKLYFLTDRYKYTKQHYNALMFIDTKIIRKIFKKELE